MRSGSSIKDKITRYQDPLCLTFALIPFACLVYFVVNYTVDIPQWDDWDLVPLLQESYQGTLSLSDIWHFKTQGHRVFFPVSLMLFLARLTNWNIFYELVVNVALASGIFLFLFYQIRSSIKSISKSDSNFFLPVLSLMIFSLSQSEGWTWGYTLPIFLNSFGVVSGIVLLSATMFTWRNLITAIFLGILATYSYGTGLCYWPIGLFILLAYSMGERNWKKSSILIWIIASGFIIFFFFYHRTSVPKPSHFSAIPVLEYVKYVLSYLGTPLVGYSTGPVLHQASLLLGLLALALFSYLPFTLVRTHKVKFRVLVPYIALGLYSIMSALMTGAGRVSFGSAQAMSSRYITISQFIWLSNILFLYIFLILNKSKSLHITSNVFKNRLLLAISYTIILMLLATSVRTSRHFIWKYQDFLRARTVLYSLESKEIQNVELKCIFPNTDLLVEKAKILKELRLSLYR